MKHRGLALVMAAVCAVLTVIAAFIYLRQDNTPPDIKIEERDITYTEGEGHEGLMDGVSAKDKVDGDLTGKVFVSKIVVTGEDSAIVYYGVMDEHKNIGTARRRVTYRSAEAASQQAEETAGEATEGGTSDVPPDQTALQPDGVRPVMALTAEQTTIRVGETFNPMNFVQGVVDDKDDASTLYQNVHADGQYNVRARGTYEIRYYVTDSDGNESDPHPFILTVQ